MYFPFQLQSAARPTHPLHRTILSIIMFQPVDWASLTSESLTIPVMTTALLKASWAGAI